MSAPMKLPLAACFASAARCGARSRERGPTSLVIWNRSAKVRYALDAVGDARCVHWEHGAAWDPGHEHDRRDYFAAYRSR